jgi:hypothetical protein
MQISDIKKAIPFLFKAKITPMLIGYHGVGKTSLVEQIAHERNANLVVIRLGQLSDPGDLLGLADFVRNSEGRAVNTVFAAPEMLPTKDTGKETILFLDEINRSHKDVIQAIFQAVESGSQLGPHKLVNTKVIAAMNPPSGDYAVLDFTDPAFNDRFCHIKFEPTKDEFLSWARENVAGDLIDFLAEHREHIEMNNNPISLDFVKPSRRSAARFQTLLNTGLPTELRFEIGCGIIGTESSAAFESYIKNKPKKIDPIAVLYDYEKVRSQVTQHNMGMLNLVSEELVEVLKSEETIITETLIQNLTNFLLDIPADLAIANIIRFIPIENFTNDEVTIDNYYNNNPALIKLVSEQRKAGVVERVSESLKDVPSV